MNCFDELQLDSCASRPRLPAAFSCVRSAKASAATEAGECRADKSGTLSSQSPSSETRLWPRSYPASPCQQQLSLA